MIQAGVHFQQRSKQFDEPLLIQSIFWCHSKFALEFGRQFKALALRCEEPERLQFLSEYRSFFAGKFSQTGD